MTRASSPDVSYPLSPRAEPVSPFGPVGATTPNAPERLSAHLGRNRKRPGKRSGVPVDAPASPDKLHLR